MSLNRCILGKILANPFLRRKLMISVIRATQAREGIETSYKQASRAYDLVIKERSEKNEFKEIN